MFIRDYILFMEQYQNRGHHTNLLLRMDRRRFVKITYNDHETKFIVAQIKFSKYLNTYNFFVMNAKVKRFYNPAKIS